MNDRKKVEATVPGPGYYNPKDIEEVRPKKGKSSQFSSKVPRFLNRTDLELSPGMYELEGDFERAIRKIHSPPPPIVRAARSPTIKVVKSIDTP